MANVEMIAIEDFCVTHHVEISFVQSLCDSGLLELSRRENTSFINQDQLPELEKLVRWHYEMDINLEGIEVVANLLDQIKTMQEEMRSLRSRLSLYENRNA